MDFSRDINTLFQLHVQRLTNTLQKKKKKRKEKPRGLVEENGFKI